MAEIVENWETTGGAFFKPADVEGATGLAVAGRSVGLASQKVYQREEYKTVVEVVADIHVFRSVSSAEAGIPDEIMEGVRIRQAGLTRPFGVAVWDGPDGARRLVDVHARLTIGGFLTPVFVEKKTDGGRQAWQFTSLPAGTATYEGIYNYIRAADAPEVLEPAPFTPEGGGSAPAATAAADPWAGSAVSASSAPF